MQARALRNSARFPGLNSAHEILISLKDRLLPTPAVEFHAAPSLASQSIGKTLP
jgi:hypothetical protein